MLKLIGAICILFSGTMIGFYQALQLSRRPRQIRQLIQALQRLVSIDTKIPPMMTQNNPQ